MRGYSSKHNNNVFPLPPSLQMNMNQGGVHNVHISLAHIQGKREVGDKGCSLDSCITHSEENLKEAMVFPSLCIYSREINHRRPDKRKKKNQILFQLI